MSLQRKSWLPKNYTVQTEVKAKEHSSVPVSNSLKNLGEGTSFAALGFDEIQGSWMNVGRNVVDVNTGDSFSNARQAIPNHYLPKGIKNQLKKAQEWREDDELLESLIEIKKDFSAIGFSLQCRQSKFSQESQDSIDQFQESLDDVAIDVNFYKVVSDLFVDYYTTDNAILYWRSKPPGQNEPVPMQPISDKLPNVYSVLALNPADCDYEDALGIDTLYIDMPTTLYEKIRKALNKITTTEREAALMELVRSGVGIKWIEAVKSGKKKVLLSKDDGDNWIIITKQRKHCGFKKPSMYNIFLDLQIRKMFKEGEFLGAYMMKHFIMLITQGESITQGPNAGSRNNWMGGTEAEQLVKIFSNVSLAMRIALNHTTEIKYIFPPAEMFSVDRYESCEQRIHNWSGVITAVMRGEGGTYSSAFIGIKKLIAHIQNVRRIIGEALIAFFKTESVINSLKPPEGTRIVARFDENVLKEPAQLLSEVKALLDAGSLDPRSSLFELGRDPDLVASRKYRCQQEQEEDEIWSPIYDRNQFGNQQDQNGGRPPNNGTVQSEDTRTQSPAPGI